MINNREVAKAPTERFRIILFTLLGQSQFMLHAISPSASGSATTLEGVSEPGQFFYGKTPNYTGFF
jgi:hypothetical protein